MRYLGFQIKFYQIEFVKLDLSVKTVCLSKKEDGT